MSVASLADNVYITVSTPSPTIAGGNPNLPSAIIGTGSWGALSAPIPFGTTATLYDAIGNISALETFDLATYGTLYLQASQAMGKGGNAYVVRVSDGSDVAAQIAVKDGQGTPGTVIIFVAACTGTRGNSGTATLSKSVGWTTNAPIYDLTLTISGAVAEVFRSSRSLRRPQR